MNQFQKSLFRGSKKKLSSQSLSDYTILAAKKANAPRPADASPIFSIVFKRKNSTYNFNSENYADMNHFWEVCQQKFKDSPEGKFIIAENSELLKEANEINEKLIELIEKPWTIKAKKRWLTLRRNKTAP